MSTTAFSSGGRTCRKAASGAPCNSRAVAARAHSNPSSQQQGSRREALLATAAAAALVLAPGNAQAFLGIGEDINKIYTEETNKLLEKINKVLVMSPEDGKDAAVTDLKKDMSNWASRYRTNNKVGGRPSFTNLYSAVNALAGHWNSFGADAPVPKKRIGRIEQQLKDVDKFLKRGR